MLENSNIQFHSLSGEDILKRLQSNAANGLTESEALERLKKFGSNTITGKKKRGAGLILVAQFKSPIVYLLLFAAGLSFWFSEWMDATAILIVLLINATIGFYMEYQAERSMDALKKLSTAAAKVIRDGRMIEVISDDLVPGDIIFLEAGDLVPADGRILNLSQLQVDESALTGESIPIEKQTDVVPAETTIAERSNMLFKGTFISKGNSSMIITNTAMQTELGKVANLVETAEQAITPLEEKLQGFSKKLIWITVVLVVIIFLSGLLYGQNLYEMLNTSIALAVAAIPEGLPIVATLALAQGMIKMARHRIIVKKLSAVETLGGTNVICTDKTGTLTKNKIEVSKIEGTSSNSEEIILKVCVLCNTAEIYSKGSEQKEIGDPLEAGLLRFAEQKGINISGLRSSEPKISEEPFSSETKIMSTVHKDENGFAVYSKGAVEELISRCDRIALPAGEMELKHETIDEWLERADKMASSGLKVIAAAYKHTKDKSEKPGGNLIFAGLIGMIDPPREDVFKAVEECRSAGIKIIMITGDHPSTSKNIAYQLKIIDNMDAEVVNGKTMSDYENADEKEKAHWLNAPVFARVSPKQKLDIISALQEKNNVVAMTGDGINDAPALKKADIGIAMGLRGTQVAQEVADMILKDDSFSSIVMAIKQGRIVFENIKKFVIFLLSCNLSELLVIAVGSIFHLHFQLFPLQILFINLITDVLPALALGVTEGGKDIMNRSPRKISEDIIDRNRWFAIFVYSTILGLTSVGAVFFSHYTVHKTEEWNAELCNNILFFALIFSQLLHVFNMGENGSSFWSSDVFKSRYVWAAVVLSVAIVILVYFIVPVRKVLSLYGMSAYDWLISIGAAFFSLILIRIIRHLKIIKH